LILKSLGFSFMYSIEGFFSADMSIFSKEFLLFRKLII